MDSILIYKLLDPQLPWPLQVRDLIILVLNLPPIMIHKLSSQLFQLSVSDRRIFANSMEYLDTIMMPASSLELTSTHQVLEERLTNSKTFMVMNQLIHQESGTSNLHKFTSETGTLLQKPVLWFWIPQGDLIIMELIMVMLRFTLQSIHLDLPMTMLQIRTRL